MKNVLDGLISRLNTAEERISELDNISVETSKSEKQIERRLKNKTLNRIFKDCEATTKGVMYA